MNYTFTDTGLVTRDPLVGAMFLGEVLKADWQLSAVCAELTCKRFILLYADGFESDRVEITIPYPLVADAMKPVEGEPCFLIHEHVVSGHLQCTMFMVCIEAYKPSLEEEGYIFVAANPLTTVTPVELRELISEVNAHV